MHGVTNTSHGASARAHAIASLAPRVAVSTNSSFISPFWVFYDESLFPKIFPFFVCERAAAGRPRKDNLS